MNEARELTSGAVLDDRYRIQSPIATGGYGRVLAARDLNEDRTVALKILHGEATDNDPRAVERMRQEAEILRAVSHPNIVRVLEVGSFDAGQFLVMEHVQGVGLDDLIERHGRLETPRLLPLVRQLLDALRAAHDTEILHRDLKPENILISTRGDDEIVKLVDFGVAKAGAVLNADDLEEGITLVKTQSGTFVGTPQYAAPEMVVGDPPQPASDLFCVGLIVYEALVGEPLVQGGSRSELVNELVFPQPFDLEAVPARWTPWLEGLLEKSPDQRPSSAGEALRRLDETFETSESPPTDSDPPSPETEETPLEQQTTIERDALHPKFADAPPVTETEIDGPPDFEALDEAAPASPPPASAGDLESSPPSSTDATPDDHAANDGSDFAERDQRPGLDAEAAPSRPPTDGTADSTSTDTGRIVLLFVVAALVAFVAAGFLMLATGLAR